MTLERDGSEAAPRRPLISVVCPVFNEAENVEALHAAVAEVFAGPLADCELELVFTDNHSTDETFARLEALAARDARVRVVRFARNFGFHASVMSGYRLARGDAAIQIDCDLQDPPALFVDFVRLWRQGHDVVVGVRQRREEGAFIQWARRGYYRILNRLTQEDLLVGGGDFRLLDRSILDQLRWIDDVHPYTRGLTSSLARSQVGVPYDRKARRAGESKYPVHRLIGLALEGLLAHTVLPLRIASFVGLGISLLSALLAFFYIAAKLLFDGGWPTGFATLAVLVLLGIGINGIFLGIIGEYVGRIYQQTRRRPITIVERTLNVPQGRGVSWPAERPPAGLAGSDAAP